MGAASRRWLLRNALLRLTRAPGAGQPQAGRSRAAAGWLGDARRSREVAGARPNGARGTGSGR